MNNHFKEGPGFVEILSHYKWLLVYIAVVVTVTLIAVVMGD